MRAVGDASPTAEPEGSASAPLPAAGEKREEQFVNLSLERHSVLKFGRFVLYCIFVKLPAGPQTGPGAEALEANKTS